MLGDPLRFRRLRRWSLKRHPLIGLAAEGRSVNMAFSYSATSYAGIVRGKVGFFHFAPTLEYPKPPLRFTSSRCKTFQKSPWTKPLPSSIEEAWEGLLAIGGDLTEAG